MSENNHNKFSGTIIAVRAVEDSIRSTKKYTEGIGTMRKKHPIQGDDFPSKTFCKYYEVYPEVELDWNMPASIALDWLWGETPCIDVVFHYDYRVNKADITIREGPVAIKQLAKTIPGFSESLAKVIANGQK